MDIDLEEILNRLYSHEKYIGLQAFWDEDWQAQFGNVAPKYGSLKECKEWLLEKLLELEAKK